MLTALLVIANVAVFAAELALGDDNELLIRRWGLVPVDITASPAAWITLLTSTLLHAGWVHLLVNLIYLAVFGGRAERRLGAARFGLLYLGSGVSGNLAYLAAQTTSATPAIGASGAIAGLIAADLVLFPKATLGSLAPVLFSRVVESAPVLWLLSLWLLAQLLSGIASVTASTAIAWWAHLGGFAGGLALAPLLRGQRFKAD
ncbi:MAG: rhomboid family intramembrane serine protease [Chloroflexota bacterium]|nr:rhomboid family intramembrane serine protease [Chloroflexota bacterium]